MDAETIAAAREQDAHTATVRASDFLTVCIDMLVWEEMQPAPRALWDAGSQLMGETGTTQTRIGFALMLDALAQSPPICGRCSSTRRPAWRIEAEAVAPPK